MEGLHPAVSHLSSQRHLPTRSYSCSLSGVAVPALLQPLQVFSLLPQLLPLLIGSCAILCRIWYSGMTVK